MPASSMTPHERTCVEELRRVIHDVRAPFACGGTFIPDQPVTLAFPDKVSIPVVRAPNSYEQVRLLQPLVNRCKAAPFGVGRKTRYDRAVRDALQIKAERGAFSVQHFDPAAVGILDQIRRELLPPGSDVPTAELYNLNIYQSGGHFVPHKDTPRGDDMLGTLVVCLPSQFSNGAFVLKHHGIFQTYDWGRIIEKQTEPTQLHWAAFFGDVDHQIERVWSGLRVTLTYLLRRSATSRNESETDSPAESVNTLVQHQLRSVLDDRRFLANGGTLAFPCSHLYHQDARFQRKPRPLSRHTVSVLKGRDYTVAQAVLAEGLEVTLFPYLIETCADETWQLGHFPTPREQTALGEEMGPTDLEKALTIAAHFADGNEVDVVWIDPPPRFNWSPTMYPHGEEGRTPADPELPAILHLHGCEYSATGYFGNEGGYTDFYVYGALHVIIPPYGEGTRTGIKSTLTQLRSSRVHRPKRLR